MREIKFRLWNDAQGFMDEVDSIDLEAWNDPDERPSNIHLMQYTGLKDKNGVEIYEGDIVRIGTLEGEPLGAIEWDENYAQYEINDNDRYKFGGEYVEHHRAQSFEVIGNIYEDPELLRGGDA
jgi:uncharacterized phage protein (TIGR01671 family)